MLPTRTQVLKYAILPEFIPRIFALFTAGFSHTAYLIALIYNALGLLPATHPYLNPQNVGRYGIRHVILEAANNLVFKRKNLDQIIIYFTVLGGMVLLALQFVLLILALVAQQPALAAPALTPFNILDVNSAFGHGALGNHQQDLAFIILDRVFGLQNIFDSCVSAGVPCTNIGGDPLTIVAPYPTGFHRSMHALFRFYSLGVFFVGVIVLLYFFVALVAETAATGTPFGQRMNKTWAPVRMIAFFALLVPLNIGDVNAGFNGAQIITFHVAKYGSNFATNAWGYFNNTITAGTTHTGAPIRMVAAPTVPELAPLVKFMFIAKTCKIAEEIIYFDQHRTKSTVNPKGIQAYLVRNIQISPPPRMPGADFRPFLSTSFADAANFSNMGNIVVRFGTHDDTDDKHKAQWGNVFPVCGELTIPVSKMDKTGDPPSGAYAVQNLYYQLIQQMWNDTIMTDYAECLVRRTVPRAQQTTACTTLPNGAFAQGRLDAYQNAARTGVDPLVDQQIANSTWNLADNVKEKGWAGAAIWYNRLAQINGDLATAIFAQPGVSKYPELLEHVAQQRRAQNKATDGISLFDPLLAKGESVTYRKTADRELIEPMHMAATFWDERVQPKPVSESAFINVVNIIFGTSGIFNMKGNTDIHPLAQLSSLGKSMMEASIRNVFIGFMGTGAAQLFKDFPGPIVGAAATALKSVGTATMAMSFVLFYILPMMPFIYFFFAVSGWIKSIFEAIVAMPLWALAHIVRMDGNGLPGPAATNGYFLLLEIFVRPILIVFGLVGSIVIFSSIVYALNQTFDIVLANLGGFDRRTETAGTLPAMLNNMRGPIDEFFFTCVYVILCYTTGISCFKLIDLIPNKILRYAGVSVATFQEGAGDPGGDVLKKTYTGGMLATNQLKGGQLATLLK